MNGRSCASHMIRLKDFKKVVEEPWHNFRVNVRPTGLVQFLNCEITFDVPNGALVHYKRSF